MWICYVYLHFPAAGRHYVYNCWKSWFYHCTVHYHCSYSWNFHEKESRIKNLDQCSHGTYWSLSSLYERKFFLSKGDFLILICSVCFAVHIMVVDHFTEKVSGTKLSCIQFLVSGALSAVLMFLFEEPHWADIFAAWLPIAYAGILSCGVAYTFQIIGQRGTDPTIASLILSLESVISVLAGWVLLNQKLSFREIIGCVLMFAAIILAQINPKIKKETSYRQFAQ